MKLMSPKILAAILLASVLPLGAVNPPGSTCSDGCYPCCDEETAATTPPSSESLSWGINLGPARYPKPTTLTGFAQGASEPNGNLPNFAQLFERYFSTSPMQQRQIRLELYQPKISAALFHPSCLFLQSEALFTSLKKPAAGGFPEYIHQVLTDSAFTLVELLPAPESGWRLRVWKRDAAPLTLSGGFYATTGFEAKTPLADVTFRRPTGSSDYNTLIYIQKETTGVSGSHIITNEITQTLDANGNPDEVTSKLFTGEGTAGALLSQQNLTYSERGTKVWDYTITRETLTSSVSASGTIGGLTLTAKTREDYDDFSTIAVGGERGMKRLVSKTQAFGISGQSPQTTTYTYIQTPENPTTHGRLESTVRPDGSWTFSEYAISPTSPVAVITDYSGWKDLTMAQRADALKTVTTISAQESLTEQYIEGQLASKSRTTLGTISGDPVTTSEKWDGAAWHVTTTAYYPDTDPAPATGRIRWIENSDGTATTYSYATVGGNLVVTKRSGAGDRSAITAGTEIKTSYNIGNHATAEVTNHIAPDITIARWDTDLSYNGGFDALGRPIKRIHNADENDYDISQYACCGLEFSRDRMGGTTSYSRDGLKRVYKMETKASAASPPIMTFTTVDGLTTTLTRRFGSSEAQFLGSSTRSLDGLTTSSTNPAANSTNAADRITTTRTITRSAGTGDTVTTSNNFDAATETTTHYLSGQMKSSVRTGYATITYDYAASSTTTTSGTLVSSHHVDLLGRTLTSSAPASGTTTYTYHPLTAAAGSRGKPATTTDADGVTISYGYNSKGEQTTTSRSIPLEGGTTATQVTTREQDVVANATLHGIDLGTSLRTTQTISSTGIAPITTATSYRAITGLLAGSESFGRQTLTIATRTSETTGIATRTTIAPDGTKNVTTTTHGLATLQQQLAADNSVIASTSATYTPLQQLETSTDSRIGTTTYSAFTESGQALTTTTPADEVTTTTLDRRGRTITVKLPDNSFTHTSYWLSGQIRARWGSQTNPVFHIYDEQLRLTELHTWQTAPTLSQTTDEPPAGSAKTEWIYGLATGRLDRKQYADTKGTSYTYTLAGRLETRTSARSSVAQPMITTYGYTHGLLTSTTYSDGTTPNVAITYDSLGRQESISNGLATSVFTYADDLGVDTETITYTLPGQPAFTRVLDRRARDLGRDAGWDLNQLDENGDIAATDNTVTYGYDPATGQFQTVANVADTFTYGYGYNQTPADPEAQPPVPACARVGSTNGSKQDFLPYTLTKSGSPILQTLRTYEARRDTLTNIKNNVGATTRSSYTYIVNQLGQRTDLSTSFDLGSGIDANPGDTAWGYDDLGQVISAAAPGTNADRYFSYDAIGNRFESRIGTATDSGGTLTEYFGALAPTTVPGANPLNQYLGIKTGSTTIEPGYDDDGNATAYPVPAYPTENSALVWDAENRLISTTVNGVTTTRHYDAQSRRIATTTGGITTVYMYDGWNVVAEYGGSVGVSPALTKTYTWGLDLSGTLQGAGGVGGLLTMSLITNNSITDNYYPTYDGNGNVSEYLAADGSTAAHFEYDPFGNTIVNTDTNNQFAYRFSTKPLDPTTGFYYYGYRYYDPLTGRWPSRDPIEERGGVNLYGFVGNCATCGWHVLVRLKEPTGNSSARFLCTCFRIANCACLFDSNCICGFRFQVDASVYGDDEATAMDEARQATLARAFSACKRRKCPKDGGECSIHIPLDPVHDESSYSCSCRDRDAPV